MGHFYGILLLTRGDIAAALAELTLSECPCHVMTFGTARVPTSLCSVQ